MIFSSEKRRSKRLCRPSWKPSIHVAMFCWRASQRVRPVKRASREIGSGPSDCGIGQLSLTFALLHRGCCRACVLPVTRSPLLFVTRFFHLSRLLLFFFFLNPLFPNELKVGIVGESEVRSIRFLPMSQYDAFNFQSNRRLNLCYSRSMRISCLKCHVQRFCGLAKVGSHHLLSMYDIN